MREVRYDRQIRLWGDEGQCQIEATSVCLIGATALGTEILKSLVLAGVGKVRIVDAVVVSAPDLGNNFFLEASDVGRLRGEAALRCLNELNPAVSGEFMNVSCEDIVQSEEQLQKLVSFSVVVGADVDAESALALSEFLFDKAVPFIYTRVFGFIGLIRVCVREHEIRNSREENPRPDLRLDRPFPALRRLYNALRLDELSPEHHRHVPYLLLYLAALEKAQKQDKDAFPDTYAQRKEFLALLWAMRKPNSDGSLDETNFEEARTAVTWSVARTRVPTEILTLFADPQCSAEATPFWQLVAALKRFAEDVDQDEEEEEQENLSQSDNSDGAQKKAKRVRDCLPLQGTLPDMTSYSESYTALAKAFHEKAVRDAERVFDYMAASAKSRGQEPSLTKEQVYLICKTAAQLRVQRGSSLKKEFEGAIHPVLEDFRHSLEVGGGDEPRDPKSEVAPKVPLAAWYLLLRASDRFRAEKSRYPGTNGIPCTIDAKDLKRRLEGILMESGAEDAERLAQSVPDLALAEMCRYAASEPHVVAALIGGIAAQEVIKLSTGQYGPVHNTLVFDAHTQVSATYEL